MVPLFNALNFEVEQMNNLNPGADKNAQALLGIAADDEMDYV